MYSVDILGQAFELASFALEDQDQKIVPAYLSLRYAPVITTVMNSKLTSRVHQRHGRPI